MKKPYVLITAAHNEEDYIKYLISSVIHQEDPPSRWIIVSDASVDGTDAIVSRYAEGFPFIELLRMPEQHGRCFASKVFAINAAAARLAADDYAFIGHFDADVSFEPDYLKHLLQRFQADPNLGIAGGVIHEEQGGRFRPRLATNVRSVAGAVQMFRRQCYQTMGGMSPLPYGGEDAYAEVIARMNGWRVTAFADLIVRHHRPTGSAGGNLLRSAYREGHQDYGLGNHPVFEVLKAARRLGERPYVLGAFARLLSFTVDSVRRECRMVSPESVKFLRQYQLRRLRPFSSGLMEKEGLAQQ